MIFGIVWAIFVRPIPRYMLSGYKRFVLRLFGAKLSDSAHVYSSAKIYNAPEPCNGRPLEHRS